MSVKDRLMELVGTISDAQAERLIRQIEEDQADIRDAEEALREAEEKGTIPWEEVKARLGLDRPAGVGDTG